MQEQRLSGTDARQVEEQDVGHSEIDGHRGSIGEGHVVRDGVDVFRGHRHQFGPGLELWQSDDTVAHLKLYHGVSDIYSPAAINCPSSDKEGNRFPLSLSPFHLP